MCEIVADPHVFSVLRAEIPCKNGDFSKQCMQTIAALAQSITRQIRQLKNKVVNKVNNVFIITSIKGHFRLRDSAQPTV